MNTHHQNSSNSSSSDGFEVDEDDDFDLSPQLRTLQSMVNPNMTRIDKRSILEETHGYLQRINGEIERMERELSQCSNNPSSSSLLPTSVEDPKITSMEVEELMEGRFVVKMNWKRGIGITGHVQRVIEECVDTTMISITVNDNNPDHMLSTAFVQVKDGRKMTEQELHNFLTGVAARFGLLP